ncbi:hypothetical protein [Paenibacillus sp. GP183]|uniref:hypothetical protein n=1 Tax=Paenibacillus sp. GP183 TaxID=1882751 RepID=UPI00089D42B6|nr:hypothetical protein [Paenibacillus sp. GP183]SEB41438.1 hypothetical protein SAMN05443246_0141 [Paenibacillus sp. GP183]
MSRYWMTPILNRLPLKLGADRISCGATAELDTFRAKLHLLHPWLLPMFKTSLLLSEDDEACGSMTTEIEWSHAQELVFDGEPFHLSHCAEAFFDRLLGAEQVYSLLNFEVERHDWTPIQVNWLEHMSNWLRKGQEVILLREDGV